MRASAGSIRRGCRSSTGTAISSRPTRLLGKDYEVITADDRLDKLAADFVEHCSTRWETGKSMLVCIDKITCARIALAQLPQFKGVDLSKSIS